MQPISSTPTALNHSALRRRRSRYAGSRSTILPTLKALDQSPTTIPLILPCIILEIHCFHRFLQPSRNAELTTTKIVDNDEAFQPVGSGDFPDFAACQSTTTVRQRQPPVLN